MFADHPVRVLYNMAGIEGKPPGKEFKIAILSDVKSCPNFMLFQMVLSLSSQSV
jgi:hypothetical protein